MRSQWRAIKKVKRNGNGLGYDISQYHLRCVKKALSEKELEQLLAYRSRCGIKICNDSSNRWG